MAVKSKKTRALYNEKGNRIGLVDEDGHIFTLAGNPSSSTWTNTRGKVIKNKHHLARVNAHSEGRFKSFDEEL
jgi:hypothetical protein